MLDRDDKKEIAEIVSEVVLASKRQSSENSVIDIKNTAERLKEEVEELKKFRKDNEAVLAWARGFMDNYKNTVKIVLAAGLIAFVGFMLQLYHQLEKVR